MGRFVSRVVIALAVLASAAGMAEAAQRYRYFCGWCAYAYECGRANQPTCDSGAKCDSGYLEWDKPDSTIDCPGICGPNETITDGCYDPDNPPTCELCGGDGEPVCPTGTSCTPGCDPTYTPDGTGRCAPCGGSDELICQDGDPTCEPNKYQAGDRCYGNGCGDTGQFVCPNGACYAGIEPQLGICVNCGGDQEFECLPDNPCRYGTQSIGPDPDGHRICAYCGGADGILACEGGACDAGYYHAPTGWLSAPITTCPAIAGNDDQTHFLNQNGICSPGFPESFARPAPESWPAVEAPTGGRGTVVVLHGRGSSCGATISNLLDDGGLYDLGHLVYCVEYAQENTPGVDRRLVRIVPVLDDLLGNPQPSCVAGGACQFDRAHPVAEVMAPAFDIPGVAAAVAQALIAAPTVGEITLVPHSQGGYIARQLLYAHYDTLRWSGREIARVVTLAHPFYLKHLDPGLSTPWLCALRDDFDCATGKWAWGWDNRLIQPGGSIDNSDYPQIDWTAISGDGPPGATSPEDVDGDGDTDAADDACLIFGGVPRSSIAGDTSVPIQSSLGYDEAGYFERSALDFDRRYHTGCTHTAACLFGEPQFDPPACVPGGGTPPPGVETCWGADPAPALVPPSPDAPAPPDALRFDGDDLLAVVEPAALAFDIGTTLTIETWIRPDAGAPAGVVINKEGEYRLGLQPSAGKNVLAWAFANAAPGLVWTYTTFAPPANEWTHVAVTYDGAATKVHADGVLIQSVAASGAIGDTDAASNDLIVGGRPGGIEGYRGLAADVRIWNRTLTRAEIIAGIGGDPGAGNTTGLLGWWPLDETSGDVVVDSGPNGFHLSLAGAGAGSTPVRIAARGTRRGGALYFDGADDFAAVSDPAALAGLDMAGALTIEAWIFPRGAGSGAAGGVIVNKEGEYALTRWGDGRITWSLANASPGWASIQSTYVAPARAWTHEALVYDAAIARVRLYINGAFRQEWTATGPIGDFHTSQNELRIGGRMQSAQFFHGVIDEVRVFDVARSAAAIAADYDRVVADPSSMPGLRGYWRFDEEPGGVAFDASGSRHASLGNASPTGRPGRSMAPQLPGYALLDPEACGNDFVDPLEGCDDGGTAGADGCSAGCRPENTFTLRGSAQGGFVSIVVEGVSVQVFTTFGQSVADILAALAAAINADPLLASRGITAASAGGLLHIGGSYSGVIVSDPGLSDCSTGPAIPSIAGDNENSCPVTTVTLTAPAASSWSWSFAGQPIAGAIGPTYQVTLSGDYTVEVRDTFDCQAVSAPTAVAVAFCAATEVSPAGAIFPLRVEETAASPTGRFIYFQKVDGADGYHLYVGTAGIYYSHGGSADNLCGIGPCAVSGGVDCYDDLGTGELRLATAAAAGDRYYYVAAYAAGVEGPAGHDSAGAPVDPAAGTCLP